MADANGRYDGWLPPMPNASGARPATVVTVVSQQLVLRIEEAVQGPLRDAGLRSDLFHTGREHALARANPFGGEQDPRALLVRGRVGARLDRRRGGVGMGQRVGFRGAGTDQSVPYSIDTSFPSEEPDPKQRGKSLRGSLDRAETIGRDPIASPRGRVLTKGETL